ncbi:MAG: hypothetical protein ABI165_00115 [Bryobacteraceae bacterium]
MPPVSKARLPGPFQREVEISVARGCLFVEETVPVPAGYQLVIESVSIRHLAPLGSEQSVEVALTTRAGGNPATLFFYPAPVEGGSNFGADVFSLHQSVRIYADPGNRITLRVTRNQPAGKAYAKIVLSGNLIPARTAAG